MASTVPAGPPGALRASALTVNGLVDPVGVDPDDCSFAWTLQGPGRRVTQTAYRVVVRRADPAHSGLVWDSGTVPSARQAFVAYAGPPLAADAAYEWTVQPRGAAEGWGPVSTPARFTTALRAADWQARWLRPAGNSQQPDRVTYLRTEVTPATGTLRRATAYVSAAHTYRLYVDGVPVDAWPSFSYPDEQYARAVDLTGALAGGRTSAIGVLHRWYGPGQGRPASDPGLLFQLVPVVRRRPQRRGRVRRELARAPGRMAALAATKLRRRRLRGVGRRAGPSPGVVESRVRRRLVVGGHGRRAGRHGAVHPDVRAADDDPRVDRPARQPAHASPAARSWRTSVPSTRPGRASSSARDRPANTVSMRAGYLLDPDGQVSTLHGTQETNLSFSYIMGTGVARPSRPSPTSGTATCRSTIRVSP